MAEVLKKCPFCAEEIKAAAKKCKHCGESIPVDYEPTRIGLVPILIVVGGVITIALVVWLGPTSKPNAIPSANAPARNAPAVQEEPLLELQALNFTKEYSFDKVEGAVKNLSGDKLEGVQVVASFYDKDDHFIKSDNAMIEYNPILPGQVSPFSTIGTDNPEIARVRVEFKYLFGGTIPHKDSAKHD